MRPAVPARALAAAALVVALAGCGAEDPCRGKSGVCVAVHVSGSAPMLDELRLAVTTPEGNTLRGDSGLTTPRITLPVQLALRLPAGTHGSLTLLGVGIANGVAVAQGETAVDLPASGHGRADLVLQPGADGDGGAGGGGGGPDLAGTIGITPDPLDFGTVTGGQSPTSTLTVTNPGPPVTIATQTVTGSSAFALDGSGSCHDGDTLGTGGICTVVIRFTAGNPGAFAGRFTLDVGSASAGADLRARVSGWVSESLSTTSPPDFKSVWGTGPDDVWIGGSGGALYHRGADGQWTRVMNVPWSASVAVTSIWSGMAGDVYVIAQASGTYHSADGGAGWAFFDGGLGLEYMQAVTGLDLGTVFLGGTMGDISVGSAGSSFVQDRTGAGKPLAALFTGSGQVFAISANAVWQRLGANDWTNILDESANAVLVAGWTVGAGDYYAVGSLASTSSCSVSNNCAIVYHVSPTAGTNRQLVGSQLTGVWGSGPSNVFVVDAAGHIYHSTGNDAWTAVSVPITGALSAIWGVGNEVFVVGASGTILHRY